MKFIVKILHWEKICGFFMVFEGFIVFLRFFRDFRDFFCFLSDFLLFLGIFLGFFLFDRAGGYFLYYWDFMDQG